MPKGDSKRTYIPAVIFLLAGLFFLGTGLSNMIASLATDYSVTSAVVVMFFLLLFAVVAVTYGFCLFRGAREDAALGHASGIFDRVNPATVAGLLAFGLAPVLFVYLNTASRELNIRRQNALLEIRPAFLMYLADHGRVPGDPRLLVPEYLPALPEDVVLHRDTDPEKWVRYQPGENTAFFCYKSGGIPAVQICYDIVNNQFRRIR